MSKIPNQIGKGIAGAAKKVGNVVAAPVRGGMMGHSLATSRGQGAGGKIAKTAQGVVAGIAHPNKITKTANLVGTTARKPQPGEQPVKAFKQQPGGPPKDVVVKLRKPGQNG